MWGDWTRSWKSMRDQNTKLTCIKWFVLSRSNSKIYNPRKRRLMSWKQGYTHIYVYTSISEWDMGKRNFNIPKDGFKNNLQLTLQIQHILDTPLEPILHNYIANLQGWSWNYIGNYNYHFCKNEEAGIEITKDKNSKWQLELSLHQ